MPVPPPYPVPPSKQGHQTSSDAEVSLMTKPLAHKHEGSHIGRSRQHVPKWTKWRSLPLAGAAAILGSLIRERIHASILCYNRIARISDVCWASISDCLLCCRACIQQWRSSPAMADIERKASTTGMGGCFLDGFECAAWLRICRGCRSTVLEQGMSGIKGYFRRYLLTYQARC
jgi:hypothetical protein